MSADDDDGKELSEETRDQYLQTKGYTTIAKQYIYVKKALFKLHIMITLDLIEVMLLQKIGSLGYNSLSWFCQHQVGKAYSFWNTHSGGVKSNVQTAISSEILPLSSRK